MTGLFRKKIQSLFNLLIIRSLGQAITKKTFEFVLFVNLLGIETKRVTKDSFSFDFPLITGKLKDGPFNFWWDWDIANEVLVSHNLSPKLHELTVIYIVRLLGMRVFKREVVSWDRIIYLIAKLSRFAFELH